MSKRKMSYKGFVRWNAFFLFLILILALVYAIAKADEPTPTPKWAERDGYDPFICQSIFILPIVWGGTKGLQYIYRKRQ